MKIQCTRAPFRPRTARQFVQADRAGGRYTIGWIVVGFAALVLFLVPGSPLLAQPDPITAGDSPAEQGTERDEIGVVPSTEGVPILVEAVPATAASEDADSGMQTAAPDGAEGLSGAPEDLAATPDDQILLAQNQVAPAGDEAPSPGIPEAAPDEVGPTPAAPSAASESQREQLLLQIARLEAVVSGRLPEGILIRQLFEVDLTDESAVQARAQLLRVRIREREEQLRSMRRIEEEAAAEEMAELAEAASIAEVEETGERLLEGSGAALVEGSGEGTGLWLPEGTGLCPAGWVAWHVGWLSCIGPLPADTEQLLSYQREGSGEGTGETSAPAPGGDTPTPDAHDAPDLPEQGDHTESGHTSPPPTEDDTPDPPEERGNPASGEDAGDVAATEGTGEAAEGTGLPAEGTGLPAEGTGEAAEGTGEAAEGTGEAAEGTGLPAEGTGLPAEVEEVTVSPVSAPLPSIDVDLVELQLQRDRLRLAFLEQPRSVRQALLDAEAMQLRIAESEQEAVRSRREAELAQERANQARTEALETQRQAATAVSRDLAGERARLEEVRSVLAGLRREYADRLQHQAVMSRERFESEDLFRQQQMSTLSHEEADAAYERVVQRLTQSRAQLRVALDLLDTKSEVIDFEPSLDLDAPPYLNAGAERDELVQAIEEVHQEAGSLLAEDWENRWAIVEELSGYVQRMNAVRLQLIPYLSPSKRSSVLGLTSEGFAQLGREIEQLELMARHYFRVRMRELRTLPGKLTSVHNLGGLAWMLTKLALLIGVMLYLSRRYNALVRVVRSGIVARVPAGLREPVLRWLNLAAAAGPSIGFLIAVKLASLILGAKEIPEVDILARILIIYGWYRFSLAVTHHLVTSAAGARRVRVSPELSKRILHSIRIIARYVFGVVGFLIVSGVVFGQGGYLDGLVVRFAWLGAFPIAFILIRRWRDSIIDTYLLILPEGRLSRVVRETRHRRVGFFVAVAAFGYVAVRGTGMYFRGFVFRFEQTRRALAYLFRRRLEKQAERSGRWLGNVEELPTALKEAFSGHALSNAVTIDYFPRLPEVQQRIEEWRKGGSGGSLALVGERGTGKSTWLAELQRRLSDPDLLYLNLTRRYTTPTDISRFLGASLGVEPCDRKEEVVEALLGGSRRLIIVDHCQNLMLRAVGGLTGYRTLTDIIGLTIPHVFWICAFSRYAWEYLDRAAPGRNTFQVVGLEPWTEAAIGQLIMQRMAAAGYEADFEELIIGRLEGVDLESEIVRTSERYRRLVWDYSDGLPWVALHFWLISLSPSTDQRVRVRLFSAPDPDELEALMEQTRFMLASLVTHENISPEELARSVHYPLIDCDIALRFLLARGVIERIDGRYRITPHWFKAVVRFLKRKHLL